MSILRAFCKFPIVVIPGLRYAHPGMTSGEANKKSLPPFLTAGPFQLQKFCAVRDATLTELDGVSGRLNARTNY